ncbi:uncharacterized protein EI90DRAFT_3152860 [Cantharellus anzutake]|uniref:uncharacterized protein n=1 Tax=Cantharellus anzutake TaxID=1750568 RepID=UPI001903F925|nr:uncharacterized protein EI90DRAFT_3152860 [Cantharellus anzutake]KAF8335871.1 hypothetical protein EI90DRAFT_3152860 [Cantharellus anzutake]
MSTALSAYLQKSASLNASLLKARLQNTFPSLDSYLFSAKGARQHDLDSVLSLAQNGIAQLELMRPGLFGESAWLFESSSRDYDRLYVPLSDTKKLNVAIKIVLSALSPFLLEAAASKAMEWLVRRFRVQEFNQEELLACFLPYHESVAFTKLMTIIRVDPNSKWAFLKPSKEHPKPLLRTTLVVEMCHSLDLARFVASLLTTALDEGQAHRSLVAFSTGTLAEYIARLPKIDEGIVAILFPSIVRMVEGTEGPLQRDVVLAGAILISALSHRCQLTVPALVNVCTLLLKRQNIIGGTRVLQTIIAVLGPQEEMRTSDFQRIAKRLIVLPNISSLLQSSTAWTNSEKLLNPFSSWLQDRLDTEDGIFVLAAIVNTQACPVAVLLRVCSASLTRALNERLESNERGKSFRALDEDVLKMIYQRHHSVFEEASRSVQASLEDERERVVFEKVIMFIALNQSSDESTDMDDYRPMDVSSAALAIRSTDGALRASGARCFVRHLKGLPEDAVHESSIQQIVEDLAAVMVDASESKEVLEALYLTSPQMLLKYVFPAPQITASGALDLASPQAVIIEKLSTILVSKDLSLEIFAVHVESVLLHLIPESLRLQNRNDLWGIYILQQLILPLLLITVPFQERSQLIWKLVSDATKKQKVLNNFELLKGLSALGQETSGSLEVEEMEAINARLIECLTENIITSGHFDHHVQYLMRAVKETEPVVRLLPQLILLSLISRLSGTRQLEVASGALGGLLSRRTVQSVGESLNLKKSEYNEQSTQELLKNVAIKPRKDATSARLDALLVQTILAIRPPKVIMNYLADANGDDTDEHHRGPAFVHLARSIYRAANYASIPNVFSLYVLSQLFSTLQNDTLLLLAGLWSINFGSSTQSPPEALLSGADLQLAALSHAKAYFMARSQTQGTLPDFQTILPSLIVPLRNKDQRARSAAVECIKQMHYKQEEQKTGPKADIFARDRVYGGQSSTVQYLDFSDYQAHIGLLCERAEYFRTDSDYINTFHREFLQKGKKDSKKESSRKRRVLCFLLSHALSWGCQHPQMAIIQSLENVHDRAKLPVIFPLLEPMATINETSPELFTCLFSTFDESSAVHLHENSNPYWRAFLGTIRNVVSKMPDLVPVVTNQIKTIFHCLSSQLKVELASLIVTLAPLSIESKNVYTELMSSLASVLDDTETIIQLLQSFQVSINDPATRVTKKPRVEEPSEDQDNSSLQNTIFLMEAVSSAKFKGTVEVVRSLLEFLERLCQNHARSRSDYDYAEQLVVSALDHASSSVESSSVRYPLPINVLVKLVQVSENPQTYQHALLVIGNLAKMSPDSIIHAIMPIFTFMGVNLFPRDDSYTFNVVLQVDRLSTTSCQSWSERVFADFHGCFSHLPKHRRNKFFTQLIACLGPQEFMSPVCMLLIEKSANKVIRRQGQDTNADLALAVSIAEHASPQHRLTLISETLAECCRLVDRVTSPKQPTEPTFFDSTTVSSGRAASSHAGVVKHIHALIIFVEFAWTSRSTLKRVSDEPWGSAGTSEIVSRLIKLISASVTSPDITLAEVNAAAQQTLLSGLKVTPAEDFVSSVKSLLQSGRSEIRNATVALLSSRVGNIAKETRQNLSLQFSAISEVLVAIIVSSPSPLSLSALEGIMLTSTPAEADSLVPAVQVLLRSGQNLTLLPATLRTLATSCMILGPRILGQMPEIINLCVSSLEGGTDQQTSALHVLSTLVKSMKPFWGTGLSDVIRQTLTIKNNTAVRIKQQINDFEELVATTLASNTVITSLMKLWDERPDVALIEEFFNLLNKAVESSSRSDISEHTRPLFKLFMDVFGLIEQENAETRVIFANIESAAISAFVVFVTKLSEATFTPLFRRFQDWGWSDVPHKNENPRRRTTFCRVMIQLMTTFKSLMSSYMISIVPNIIETLEAYSSKSIKDSILWSDLMRLVTVSFSVDKSTPVLKDTQLSNLITPLAKQISVWPGLPSADREDLVPKCITRFFGALGREELIKKLNMEVVLQTRSEDVKVRLLALKTAIHSWTEEGITLSPFATDMVTFIHDCSEDENDQVAKAARSLKRVLIDVAGSLGDL